MSRRSLGEGGFTLVEVMMASVILVVGFLGMIQAVTIGSELLATARRQTIAAQILNHELEKMRLTSWTTLDSLATATGMPTATTWNSGTAYTVGTTVRYYGGWFTCTQAHTNHAPTETAYWAAAASTYSATRSYLPTDVVYYAPTDAWYRCLSATTGNLPTSTTYWEAYTGPLTTSTAAGGVTFAVSRIVTSPTTNLREVTFVVSWTKSGTTAAATTATGSWLSQLSFSGSAPIARSYSRSSTTWITKYGLNHAIQRS